MFKIKSLAVILSDASVAVIAFTNPDGEFEFRRFDFSDSPDTANDLQFDQWLTLFDCLTDDDTQVHFIPPFFTEQTRTPNLRSEFLDLDDRALALRLADAQKSDENDEAGSPIFDHTSEEFTYDFARLPDDTISLTELPRNVLEAARNSVFRLPVFNRDMNQHPSGDDFSQAYYFVETHLRGLARFSLSNNPPDPSDDDDCRVVFISVDKTGGGFAFYNRRRGFYFETGEVFNMEDAQMFDESAEDFYKKRIEQLIYSNLDRHLFSPGEENSENLQIRWSASSELEEIARDLFLDYAEERHLQIVPATGTAYPQAAAIACGLLMHDGDDAAAVASINLAFDVNDRASEVIEENNQAEIKTLMMRRQRVVTMFLLPVIAALALATALYFDLWRENHSLNGRIEAARAEKSRLQPKLDNRRAYEESYRWFQDVFTQTVGLRATQQIVPTMFVRLNGLYPPEAGFYISYLQASPGGGFEVKGLTRDEQLVTSFVRRLEYSDDTSGGKLFNNLQLEFKQGSEFQTPAPATVTSANATRSSVTLSDSLRPGISSFLVTGTYVPMIAVKSSAPAANVRTKAKTPDVPAAAKNQAQPNAAEESK